MRNIGDKVVVELLGEICNGKIIDIGGHGRLLYQVLIDNDKRTCAWFDEEEIN